MNMHGIIITLPVAWDNKDNSFSTVQFDLPMIFYFYFYFWKKKDCYAIQVGQLNSNEKINI